MGTFTLGWGNPSMDTPMASSSIKNEILVRPFDPEIDIPGVARILRACEIVDWEGEQSSEEALRQELDWPDHDPRQDRWVVELPDRPGFLIGYGLVWAKTPTYADVFVATHPSYRERGIGREVLRRAVERARRLGVRQVGAYANTVNAAASAFLYRQGWTPVSSYWDLVAPPDMGAPDPVWPPGYTVGTYDPDRDVSLLVETLNRSYGDLWGHGLAREDSPWVTAIQPTGVILVIAPDGSPAGVCRFHAENGGGRSGYIDAPGVTPEHRHAGLYRPQVLAALRVLWSDDRFPVRMESWGDDPPVVEMYREMGFVAHAHDIAFRLDLA